MEIPEGLYQITVERGTAEDDALEGIIPDGMGAVIVGSAVWGELVTYLVLIAPID